MTRKQGPILSRVVPQCVVSVQIGPSVHGIYYPVQCTSMVDSAAVTGLRYAECSRAPNYMVWYGMVDVCDGYLAAEASGSSFG